VPETHREATAVALDVDPLNAQIRQVYFFDTPDLQLDAAGVVVRARRVQGRGDDSTVKIRPVEPAALPKRVRRSPNMVVEVDAMPGGHMCSASMKCALTAADVRSVANGRRAIRKLYSKEQRQFFEAHAPEGITLDDLTPLGPITVFKLKVAPPDFGRKCVVEQWNYPDASRVLELSTRTTPGEAFQVAAEARAFLTRHGVEMSGTQATKTRSALDFFSTRQLAQA
jgi:hypothetical protein